MPGEMIAIVAPDADLATEGQRTFADLRSTLHVSVLTPGGGLGKPPS